MFTSLRIKYGEVQAPRRSPEIQREYDNYRNFCSGPGSHINRARIDRSTVAPPLTKAAGAIRT